MLDRRLIIEQTDTVRAALTLRHADDETMTAWTVSSRWTRAERR